MKLRTSLPARRTAFTLVELLVVIAIIAVLVGLTAATAMKFLGEGPKVQNRHEIQQLSAAIAQFKQKMQVDYIPSRIRLCRYAGDYAAKPTKADYGGVLLDNQSQAYMLKLFPRCAAQWNTTGANGGIIWNGANPDAILYGEECLVFFLGGQQLSPPGVGGFWSNPANPMLQGTSATPIGPFYDFRGDRLVLSTNPLASGYFRYKDVYNTPFAYFSSYKTRNGYTPYRDQNGNPTADSLMGVAPYIEASNRYYNPETFQIISAGPDKTFGAGGTSVPVAITSNGGDDLSNFAERSLGAQ